MHGGSIYCSTFIAHLSFISQAVNSVLKLQGQKYPRYDSYEKYHVYKCKKYWAKIAKLNSR